MRRGGYEAPSGAGQDVSPRIARIFTDLPIGVSLVRAICDGGGNRVFDGVKARFLGDTLISEIYNLLQGDSVR